MNNVSGKPKKPDSSPSVPKRDKSYKPSSSFSFSGRRGRVLRGVKMQPRKPRKPRKPIIGLGYGFKNNGYADLLNKASASGSFYAQKENENANRRRLRRGVEARKNEARKNAQFLQSASVPSRVSNGSNEPKQRKDLDEDALADVEEIVYGDDATAAQVSEDKFVAQLADLDPLSDDENDAENEGFGVSSLFRFSDASGEENQEDEASRVSNEPNEPKQRKDLKKDTLDDMDALIEGLAGDGNDAENEGFGVSSLLRGSDASGEENQEDEASRVSNESNEPTQRKDFQAALADMEELVYDNDAENEGAFNNDNKGESIKFVPFVPGGEILNKPLVVRETELESGAGAVRPLLGRALATPFFIAEKALTLPARHWKKTLLVGALVGGVLSAPLGLAVSPFLMGKLLSACIVGVLGGAALTIGSGVLYLAVETIKSMVSFISTHPKLSCVGLIALSTVVACVFTPTSLSVIGIAGLMVAAALAVKLVVCFMRFALNALAKHPKEALLSAIVTMLSVAYSVGFSSSVVPAMKAILASTALASTMLAYMPYVAALVVLLYVAYLLIKKFTSLVAVNSNTGVVV